MLVLLAAGPASASPNRVGVTLAEEIGVLSATHTTVTGSYMRRFWHDRLYAEARFGAGTTGTLLVLEERAGIGVVFRSGERIEVLVGWRFGHSHFGGELNDTPFTLNLLAFEVAVQFGIAVARDWRVRVVPVAPTLFWNKTYGGSIGLELGVDYAF